MKWREYIDNNQVVSNGNDRFFYDAANRLTSVGYVVPGQAMYLRQNLTYEDNGNISSKDDCGDYVYGVSQKPYLLSGIQNATGNTSFNTLSLTFNALRKIEQIAEAGSQKQFDFVYGNDEQRIRIDYKVGGQLQYTRFYQDQFDREETSSTYREWSYVYAPTGLVAVNYDNNGSEQILYINTDHLGSPIMVTDASGSVWERYSFDSWGRRRNPADWNDYTNNITRQYMIRGFTGHEHLDEVGIINMNGRIYEPVLGRFLQPDNYVQAPGNLQNYNRYGYVWNNPLNHTDPSGDFIAFTDAGYDFWKHVSPIAVKVNINLGSEDQSLGFDVSAGCPQYMTIHGRVQAGVTYHFGTDYNGYRGFEGRYGFEVGITIGSVGFKTAMTYYDFEGSEFDQVTNQITIGNPIYNVKYENDYMFGFPADGGDRYRTTGLKISFGEINAGINLYTGDPGRADGVFNRFFADETIRERTQDEKYYVGKADQYRLGAAYIGIAGIRIGRNSENIRHAVQNRFAHDIMFKVLMGNKLPHFRKVEATTEGRSTAPEWYFNLGTGTGNSLW